MSGGLSRRIFFLLFVLAAATVLTSASSGARIEQARVPQGRTNGGTFRLDYPYDPGADPVYADYQINPVVRAVCANLFNYRDEPPSLSGMRLFPELAAGLPRLSAGGHRQTITLRTSYRFSNGERVRPADVVATINRVLAGSPSSGSGAVTWMYTIRGARAVADGHAKAATGVRMRGNTVTFDLLRPDGALAAKLAGPQFCVMPRSALVDASHPLTMPITAGPYFVASHDADHSLVLKVNKYYRGPRPHRVSAVVVSVVDETKSVADVEAGKADWSTVDPSPQFEALARRVGKRLKVEHVASTHYVALNTSRRPVQKPRR